MTETLPHRERITILSRRLWNLRHGQGEYTPPQRAEEIEQGCYALQQAFADQRRDWISARK